MKAFATARWGMETQSVYLLEDRIEVGTMSTMYVEEMRRVAYRDVVAVTTWRTRRPLRFVIGALFVLAGIATGVVAISLAQRPTWILEPILIGLGCAVMWWGREGSVLQFRVAGTRGAVQSAIVGSYTKQQRFVAELLRKIDERGGARAAPSGQASERLPPSA